MRSFQAYILIIIITTSRIFSESVPQRIKYGFKSEGHKLQMTFLCVVKHYEKKKK